MKRWNIKLNDVEMLNHATGQRVQQEIDRINQDMSSPARITWVAEVLIILKEIGLKPDIWRSQNMFYLLTKGYRKGLWAFVNKEWKTAFEQLATLLKVRLLIDR